VSATRRINAWVTLQVVFDAPADCTDEEALLDLASDAVYRNDVLDAELRDWDYADG
jgi:hypothetical protein